MKMTWLYMLFGLLVKTMVLLLLTLQFSCYVALLKPHKLYWTNLLSSNHRKLGVMVTSWFQNPINTTVAVKKS